MERFRDPPTSLCYLYRSQPVSKAPEIIFVYCLNRLVGKLRRPSRDFGFAQGNIALFLQYRHDVLWRSTKPMCFAAKLNWRHRFFLFSCRGCIPSVSLRVDYYIYLGIKPTKVVYTSRINEKVGQFIRFTTDRWCLLRKSVFILASLDNTKQLEVIVRR